MAPAAHPGSKPPTLLSCTEDVGPRHPLVRRASRLLRRVNPTSSRVTDGSRTRNLRGHIPACYHLHLDHGTDGGTRTPDTRLRRPLLCPLSYARLCRLPEQSRPTPTGGGLGGLASSRNHPVGQPAPAELHSKYVPIIAPTRTSSLTDFLDEPKLTLDRLVVTYQVRVVETFEREPQLDLVLLSHPSAGAVSSTTAFQVNSSSTSCRSRYSAL